MAVLSVEVPHSSAASPQKARAHRRVRAASVSNKQDHSRPSSRPCPMHLEDMIPGLGGDFAKTSISPRASPHQAGSPAISTPAKTPLSRKVQASAMSLPGVAQLHKLPLREFQESDVLPPRNTSNSNTPLPSGRRRSQSLSSLDTTRPSSVGCMNPDIGTSSDGLRPLTRHERSQMNHDAVDWFRASQAINNHVRSRQETETILAAVRDRRNHVVKRCTSTKVKKVEDVEVESVIGDEVNGEVELAVASPLVEEQPKRKVASTPPSFGMQRPSSPQRRNTSRICKHLCSGRGPTASLAKGLLPDRIPSPSCLGFVGKPVQSSEATRELWCSMRIRPKG
jgi:hypothetical protein